MKSNRVPVLLDGELAAKMREYSEITGVPLSQIATVACLDWIAKQMKASDSKEINP